MKKRFFTEQIYIAAGTFLLAAGINIFLLPSKLSSGGVTSVGTILLYLCGIRLSVTNIAANAVLFIFGRRYLGKQAVIKTVFGIIYLSLFLELTSKFPQYPGSMLVAAISGGVLMGAGIGLVVRIGASTGGSDFLSLILKHFFPHIPVSTMILITDGIIITVAGIIFKSFEITFYSITALFFSYKITDFFLTFGNSAKAVRIFSDKYAQIAASVLTELERGVSAFSCKGMYTDKNGCMLLCVVSPKEIPQLISTIKYADSAAFIVVSEVTEVLGEGF